MFNELANIEDGSGRDILDSAADVCHKFMGKIPEEFTKGQFLFNGGLICLRYVYLQNENR